LVNADIDRNKIPDRERDEMKSQRKAAVAIEVGEMRCEVTYH